MTDFWDRITVVFIVHNSESVLPGALKSLEKARRIIIIDNASTDGSAYLAKRLNERVEIIHNPNNTGVSMPSNMAFGKVSSELILHMNPDVQFDQACIERLVHSMDSDPNAAVISPMIINANGDQEIDVMGAGEIEHQKIAVPPEGPFCTWYVCGSVWLWRTAALQELNGFDSNIFLYNEDVDICIRASQAGFSLIVDTEAIIHHGGGASERISYKTRWRKDWNLTWSHFYLKSKHRSLAEATNEAHRKRWKFACNALWGLATFRPKTVVGQLARVSAINRFLKGEPSWLRTEWARPKPY